MFFKGYFVCSLFINILFLYLLFLCKINKIYKKQLITSSNNFIGFFRGRNKDFIGEFLTKVLLKAIEGDCFYIIALIAVLSLIPFVRLIVLCVFSEVALK